MRKFYRNVVTIEVLSEEHPIVNADLADIAEAITAGDLSGGPIGVTSETVTPKRMAELLQAQGSDPEFFQLDTEGNDLEN